MAIRARRRHRRRRRRRRLLLFFRKVSFILEIKMEQPRRSFKLFFALLLLQHCLGQQTSNMYAELQNIYEGIQQGYNRNLRPGETILDLIQVVEMIISLLHVTGDLNLHLQSSDSEVNVKTST